MKKLLLLFPCGVHGVRLEELHLRGLLRHREHRRAEVSLTVPGGNSSTEVVDLPVRNRGLLANALGKVKPQQGR
ncbi:hypothetical protein [Lentzea jiangxiensis]|uniref:hypothetical protein n=1 Tax=Lentzea jiangxiensis TaxID=641025 RepID=UPI00115FC4E3|nr:hypothetical protein [Lentzea jiangxiensis]